MGKVVQVVNSNDRLKTLTNGHGSVLGHIMFDGESWDVIINNKNIGTRVNLQNAIDFAVDFLINPPKLNEEQATKLLAISGAAIRNAHEAGKVVGFYPSNGPVIEDLDLFGAFSKYSVSSTNFAEFINRYVEANS